MEIEGDLSQSQPAPYAKKLKVMLIIAFLIGVIMLLGARTLATWQLNIVLHSAGGTSDVVDQFVPAFWIVGGILTFISGGGFVGSGLIRLMRNNNATD